MGQDSTATHTASVFALEHYPALRLLFRVRSWVVPLASSGVRAWDIERTLSRESRAQAILQRGGSTYVLAGPDAALLEARDRGAAYGERMILIGGTAAALLLGFAMVAAIGLRRGIAAERHRLLRRGSSRTQVWIALFTEVGAITVAGWIVGVVVGGLVIGVLAAMLDLQRRALSATLCSSCEPSVRCCSRGCLPPPSSSAWSRPKAIRRTASGFGSSTSRRSVWPWPSPSG
jgi:hypothetical protein